MSTDNSPNVLLSKQTFELRITSHQIKQINASLGLTKVVLVCLFKVIHVSPSFKTKSAHTFAKQTTQLSIKTCNRHSPEG